MRKGNFCLFAGEKISIAALKDVHFGVIEFRIVDLVGCAVEGSQKTSTEKTEES
jgi:hypothetical protein